MAELYRRHKSDLRKNHYDKYDNDEDRSKNCPPLISQADWDGFLVNEGKPVASDKRNQGKINISKLSYVHHTGHTSHTAIEHALAIENPSKRITRREVWENAHTKKDGTISESASSNFDQIAKTKETINDSDEESLPLDDDIVSQVFGKDIRGRTRSVGSKISRTQIKAFAIACEQLKRAKGESTDLKNRLDNMEGKLDNQSKILDTLIDLLTKRYTSQENRSPSTGFDEGGSNTTRDVLNQPSSLDVSNQNNCKLLNYDSEVIAIATVCRDSAIIHGRPLYHQHKRSWCCTVSCYRMREQANKIIRSQKRSVKLGSVGLCATQKVCFDILRPRSRSVVSYHWWPACSELYFLLAEILRVI